ncbi:MAG: S8 family serine peptidase [Solirubrobacterales bacterium]|nr:S8 family serine peptidase [Solirubrobacterales bacterium]
MSAMLPDIRMFARASVLALLGVAIALALAVAALATPVAARAADYVPGQVVVGYTPGPVGSAARALANRMGIRAAAAPAPSANVMKLPGEVTVGQALTRLRRQPGVAYAVPNYIARAAGSFIPNDPGRAGRPGGWEAMQWNFLPTDGVNAPGAWANLIADGHPGGRGAVVAILDTGVAYRSWHQFKESPDFRGTRFVHPYDFVAGNRYPLDRNGHGTFVAGTVAEATNNHVGLTGLAYGASIMPVRILDSGGLGDASTIARGIRYAANNGANVINLSLEFGFGITASDIPDIISAIEYAHRRGVVVVAAAGNEGADQLAYPAADPVSISVGATTSDRCLAEYSNGGNKLDLVAPGGGDDAQLPTDPDCHPSPTQNLPSISQMTLTDAPRSWSRFGYPSGIYGTSMAAPHVSAAAALVIASGVLGRHPSPAQVLRRLELTAKPLGGSQPNASYGYGLLDAGAATAPIASAAGKRR